MPKVEGRHANGALTPRQRRILALVAQGHSHAAIAGCLPDAIGRSMVAEEMRRVTAKMQVKNSWEAVALWGRMQGLLEAAELNDRVPSDRNGSLAQALKLRAAGLIP